MHDLKWIRENPKEFDQHLQKRGLEPHADQILALDQSHRTCTTETQELQQKRNDVAKQMGMLRGKGENTAHLVEEGTAIKKRLAELEEEKRTLKENVQRMLASLPNVFKDDVPAGTDETENVTVRTFGEPTQFDFEPKQHFDLGENLGLMDFEQAAHISGSRFVVLKGKLARLERALHSSCWTPHGQWLHRSIPAIIGARQACSAQASCQNLQRIPSTQDPIGSSPQAKSRSPILCLVPCWNRKSCPCASLLTRRASVQRRGLPVRIPAACSANINSTK